VYARDEEFIALAGLGCWGVVSLVVLLLTILYLSSLSRALAACGPARRTLEPGLVWLNLIPLFHLFWKLWTSAQVGTSLRHEFDARGMRTGFTFGRAVGAMVPLVALLTRFVFWVGGFVASRTGEEEIGLLVLLTTALLGVLELILLIVHWVQINGYTHQLNSSRPAAGDYARTDVDDGGERDFDEDYRPITRTRRRRTAE
jgi:hypothetical protein